MLAEVRKEAVSILGGGNSQCRVPACVGGGFQCWRDLMEAGVWLEHDLEPIQSIFGAQRREGRLLREPSCRALPLKGVQLFLCVRYSLNPVK